MKFHYNSKFISAINNSISLSIIFPIKTKKHQIICLNYSSKFRRKKFAQSKSTIEHINLTNSFQLLQSDDVEHIHILSFCSMYSIKNLVKIQLNRRFKPFAKCIFFEIMFLYVPVIHHAKFIICINGRKTVPNCSQKNLKKFCFPLSKTHFKLTWKK